MGGESLQEFVWSWHMRSLYIFKQVIRRTWIIRVATDLTQTILARDFGIAIVNGAGQERQQAPYSNNSSPLTKRAEKHASY